MMFEIRRPTNADPARGARTAAAIVSPTTFDSEYDDSGRDSINSSIGAKSGGRSNGSPSTVSLDAQTTTTDLDARPPRRRRCRSRRCSIRNVSPSGRSCGAGDRGEMDDGVGAGKCVLRLPEIGQVRRPGIARTRVPSCRASTLRTSWPCARRSRTTQAPPLPLPPVTTTRTAEILLGREYAPLSLARGSQRRLRSAPHVRPMRDQAMPTPTPRPRGPCRPGRPSLSRCRRSWSVGGMETVGVLVANGDRSSSPCGCDTAAWTSSRRSAVS